MRFYIGIFIKFCKICKKTCGWNMLRQKIFPWKSIQCCEINWQKLTRLTKFSYSISWTFWIRYTASRSRVITACTEACDIRIRLVNFFGTNMCLIVNYVQNTFLFSSLIFYSRYIFSFICNYWQENVSQVV